MPENALTLEPAVRDRMVETKVTCPFLGSIVHQDLLPVSNAPDNPLAGIEELQRLRNGRRIDDADLFAHRFQDRGQPQFRAEGIRVGADVAGNDESAIGSHDLAQRLPIDDHVVQ